jgi:hypothetical protein
MLQLIEQYLLKYKRGVVVDDGIHYLTLLKSIEKSFGKPTGAYSIEN